MLFSEVLRLTSGNLQWSPDGNYLAIAVTARLEIREGDSEQLLQSFNCIDVIQKLEWSPDSSLILTANFTKGFIEVWNPSVPSWKCRIDEGALGLVKLNWAPDSQHILTIAEFHLQLTIWSLANKTVCFLKFPKIGNPGLDFTQDGDYLAVAERRDCKDCISILEAKSWHLIKTFEITTTDLEGLKFSPDGSVLAVWDSHVEYKVLIYTLNGQCLSTFSAYQLALGVRSVVWSPSSQFLAIGSYDQSIRLLNHITWKCLINFSHSLPIDSKDCFVYKEVEKPLTGYPATLAAIQGHPLILDTSYEEETTRPLNLTQFSSPRNDLPKMGVCSMIFSNDGRYLASRVEDMPTTVWIWSIEKQFLHTVLVHCNPVKDMTWSKKQSCLSICTGGSHIYLWTPFGCLTVALPDTPSMKFSSLRWHRSGSKLAAVGKDEFSVLFLNGLPCENKENANISNS